MALRIVVSLEIGNFAVHFFDLHSGSLIQIPLELFPLDQRPVSIHNIEIFVGVLVDQHAIWMIELKNGTHIGDLNFKGITADGMVEIGYGILEEQQRKGYATPPFLYFL